MKSYRTIDSSKNAVSPRTPSAFLTGALFFLGGLFCAYTVFLHVKSPGTILDILTAFSNIWLFGGLLLFGIAIFRIRKGHSLWSILSRKVRTLILVIISLGAAVSAVNLWFILRAADSPLPQTADYVIILGGGIDKNGKLPPSVENRALKGAQMLQMYPQARGIVTGGTLKFLPFPEAPAIKDLLTTRCNLAPDRIYMEDQALDTIQNFQNSAALIATTEGRSLQDIKNARVIVVTNYFHLARALRIARRLGFTNVTGAGAHIKWYDAPMAYLREICAYIKLNARILLTGNPSL